jgi:hypothetical protein
MYKSGEIIQTAIATIVMYFLIQLPKTFWRKERSNVCWLTSVVGPPTKSLVSTVYPAPTTNFPANNGTTASPTLPSLQQHVPSQLTKSANNNNFLRHPSLPSQSRNPTSFLPNQNGDRHRSPATPQLLHHHHYYYTLLIDIIFFIARLTVGRPAAAGAAVAQLLGQRADAAAAGGPEL